MHFALGTRTPCVNLFTCTSPWEIYHYGVRKKIVSPLLEEFFYKRGYDERATTAISVDEVLSAVMTQLEAASQVANRITVKLAREPKQPVRNFRPLAPSVRQSIGLHARSGSLHTPN